MCTRPSFAIPTHANYKGLGDRYGNGFGSGNEFGDEASLYHTNWWLGVAYCLPNPQALHTQESLCSQFSYFQFCWIAERLCLNLSGMVTFPSLLATPHPLGKVPWASSTRLANSPHNDLLTDTSSGSLLVVPKTQRAAKTATNTTKTASNIQATAIFFQTIQVTPSGALLHKSRD